MIRIQHNYTDTPTNCSARLFLQHTETILKPVSIVHTSIGWSSLIGWVHDVVATLNQRHWRWFNVAATSCARWIVFRLCRVTVPVVGEAFDTHQVPLAYYTWWDAGWRRWTGWWSLTVIPVPAAVITGSVSSDPDVPVKDKRRPIVPCKVKRQYLLQVSR